MKLNKIYLSEEILNEKGNVSAPLFREKAVEVNELQEKINQTIVRLQALVRKRALAGAELDLLRTKFDANSPDFDLLTLRKQAARNAKSGPFSKNFPRQVADDVKKAIKRG